MHILFICQILRNGQCTAGRQDTLNDGVVGQVQEHGYILKHTAVLKALAEVIRHVVFDTHGSEYNGKFLSAVLCDLGLPHDLHCQLVGGQAGTGKDGQLLSTNQGHQAVDGGNARANVVSRIGSGNRVQRLAVDVRKLFRENISQSVNGLACAVEHSAQYFLRQWHFHRPSQKFCFGILQRKPLCALEHLEHCLVAGNFYHTTQTLRAVLQMQLRNLVIADAADLIQDNQRSVDLIQSKILQTHAICPSSRAALSFSNAASMSFL